MSTRLPEETMLALDEAAYAYLRAVQDILKKHSDEELEAFVGDAMLESMTETVFDDMCRSEARFELYVRRIFRSRMCST